MAFDDISNTSWVRGPLPATIHEAGCGPSKSPDQVCVCVKLLQGRKTYHIYKVVLQTIKIIVRTPSKISELVVRNHI
jgi:hypothetical protein